MSLACRGLDWAWWGDWETWTCLVGLAVQWAQRRFGNLYKEPDCLFEEITRLQKFHWAYKMRLSSALDFQCPPLPSTLLLPGQENTRLSLLYLLILCSVQVNTNNWKYQVGCQQARNLPSTGFHLLSAQFCSIWKELLDQGQHRLLLSPLSAPQLSADDMGVHQMGICEVHSERKFLPKIAKAKGFQLGLREETILYWVPTMCQMLCIFIPFFPNNNPAG